MFKKLLTYFLSGPATPGGEAWSSHFFESQKEKRKQSGKKKEFQRRNYQNNVTMVKILLF